MPSLSDALGGWYGFYSLIGTASATLVGLLFVAASVGTDFYSEDKAHAFRAFLSPTVVHFSSVLVACLVVVAPVRNWALTGLLIGADGLFGVLYAGAVWRNIVRHGYMAHIGLDDRIGYAALPVLGHAATVGAGLLFVLRSGWSCGLLACALGMLLLIGIRNAWDMTAWSVMRSRR